MAAVRTPLIPAPQLWHPSRIIQTQRRQKPPLPEGQRQPATPLLTTSPLADTLLQNPGPRRPTAQRVHRRAVRRAAWTAFQTRASSVFHLRLPVPPAATPRSGGLCEHPVGKRGGDISYNTGFQTFLITTRSYKKYYFKSRPRAHTMKGNSVYTQVAGTFHNVDALS